MAGQGGYPTYSDPQASARLGEAVAYTGGTFTPTISPTGILVGVAGNIVGKLLDDTGNITYPVVAGMNPLRFASITESGTTATGLVVVRG